MKKITFLFLFVSTALFAQETTLVNSNFTTFTDGPLAGQNGWVQYNTAATSPIAVTSGVVSFIGARTTDDQDVMYPFPSTIQQPAAGVTTLHFDLLMSVASAGASTPSYFLALNGLTNTTSSGNYQNARIAAIQNGDGFVFGVRVNGQGGYPYAYGTNKLTFNTYYAVRAEIKMVAGNANDTIKLFVGPDFNNLTLQSTCAYTSGTVADPTYGAALISQYGNATTIESGISIKSLVVTNLGTIPTGFSNPETSSIKIYNIGRKLYVENTQVSTVEIFNAIGSKVQNLNLVNGSAQLNLSKGLYIIRAGKQTAKIIL